LYWVGCGLVFGGRLLYYSITLLHLFSFQTIEELKWNILISQWPDTSNVLK